MAKENEAQEAPVAAAGGAAAPPEPKRRVSRRLLLFVILPLVLLLAGGAGYYFFFFKKAQDETKAEKPPPPPKTYVFYNLPGFVVNLPSSTAGRTSFLKVTISLELDSQADVPKVQAVMPRIVDHVQSYLRELRPEDVKGTAGISRMRQEMLDRVVAAAPGAKVDDVLLQELLLQ
ncbi:MAG TPA: flagellar basal body-associated FliL family protein [Alphaproteobacteria bacterium]|nr:flagellar basal body-associated FliL family protein [Alphaproteobacteria bacterium]